MQSHLLQSGCLEVTVTNGDDSGAGSLRQALAEVCEGGRVTFGGSYSIYLESSLSLSGTVTVDGSGQAVTISGDSGNNGSRNVGLFVIGSTGVVTLTNLTLVDGMATEGAAIYSSGQLTVRESSFARNHANASGGALFSASGTLTVEQSTFVANTAGVNGGAVWVESNTTTIRNSTFSGNSATNGGGLAMFVTSTSVTHTTFSGNSATNGADIRRLGGSLAVHNSILANSAGGANCVGGLTTNAGNLIEDGTCSPALSGDPLLSALGDYGGSTQTFALRPGSAAIDAGNEASCLTTDQRGLARTISDSCDIGAVEFQGYSLAINSGNSQTATIQNAFSNLLVVTLTSIDTNETADAGNLVSFTAPDTGASLNLASVTATTDANGVASAAVTANDVSGSYVVTATATGTLVPAAFNLTNSNASPSLSAIADKQVDEGSPLSFTAIGSDPDLPAPTLSYSLVGAPAGASIDASTGLFSWTPSEDQGPDSYLFTVRVDDGSGLSSELPVTVVVGEINASPAIGAIADVQASQGFPVSLQVIGSDSDLPRQTLTYSLMSAPAGATIDPATGLLSWTPTSAGSHAVQVAVSDGGRSADTSFTIVVAARLVIYGAQAPASVAEGEVLTITITRRGATDVATQVAYSLGGSATPDADYAGAMMGLISFAAGETQATLSLPISDDAIAEGAESLSLTLAEGTDPLGGTVSYDPATVTVAIADELGERVYLPLLRR